MKKNNRILVTLLLLLCINGQMQAQRQTELFTDDWRFYKGDVPGAQSEGFNDVAWRTLELPHDWSIEGPFSQEWASGTGFLPGGIAWYRKTWTNENAASGKKSIYLFRRGI